MLLDKHHLHLLMVPRTQTEILLAAKVLDVHRINMVHLLLEVAKVTEMDMEAVLLTNMVHQEMKIILVVKALDAHPVNMVHLQLEMDKVAEMDMESPLQANMDLQEMEILSEVKVLVNVHPVNMVHHPAKVAEMVMEVALQINMELQVKMEIAQLKEVLSVLHHLNMVLQKAEVPLEVKIDHLTSMVHLPEEMALEEVALQINMVLLKIIPSEDAHLVNFLLADEMDMLSLLLISTVPLQVNMEPLETKILLAHKVNKVEEDHQVSTVLLQMANHRTDVEVLDLLQILMELQVPETDLEEEISSHQAHMEHQEVMALMLVVIKESHPQPQGAAQDLHQTHTALQAATTDMEEVGRMGKEVEEMMSHR